MNIPMRFRFSSTPAVLFVLLLVLAAGNATLAENGTTWQPLRIGGGGYLSGIDISPDGLTKVVRTDTYGAYILNQSTGLWEQLVTQARMPAGYFGPENFNYGGVSEIVVAPSDSTRIYMAYLGYVFKSTNRGATFTVTSLPYHDQFPNGPTRMATRHMAVDPVNADVVYLTTDHDGVWTTSDGGAHWSQIGTAIIPTNRTIDGIAYNFSNAGCGTVTFDPTSGTTGGKTNVIYISSFGNGVYQSTTAGASWSALPGGLTNVIHSKIAVDGIYYATNFEQNKIYKYAAGSWTDITPSADIWTEVLVDPNNAAHITAVRAGGYLNDSTNRGASWSGINFVHSRVATDVPWLATAYEVFMSEANMLYDPIIPGKIWFAEGIGVWTTTTPIQPPGTNQVWTSVTAGIEQLVANQIIAPPGGNPVLLSGDRAVFYVNNPDVFPANQNYEATRAINAGTAGDWAPTTPSFLVAIVGSTVQRSGYSTDGGRTWTAFSAFPPNFENFGGTLSASSTTNFLWTTSNNANPYYTTDRGATWRMISIPGVPDGPAETGWGSRGIYGHHFAACADRVDPGTFYMHNYGPSGTGADPAGIWKSTDGGATWAQVHHGNLVSYTRDYWQVSLRCVPGKSGHLFFATGQVGSPGQLQPDTAAYFMRSTDHGATWTAVPNVLEVSVFGFGAAAPNAAYPSVYIVGWVNQGSGYTYGIWKSDDNCVTWTLIGQYPMGWGDQPSAIDGDKNTYGTVYIGFAGSGYAYGSISATTADTTPPSVPGGLSAAIVSSTQVNLSWTASTDNVGVAGYKVFRNGTQIGTTAGTSFQDTQFPGVTSSTPIGYSVVAYDAAGNTSAPAIIGLVSSRASAPMVAINAPSNGTTLKGNGSVNIAASASDSSGIASISITVDGSPLQTCTNTTSCSVTWQGKKITQGTHTISAAARNNSGTSASASISILSLR